MKHLQFSFLFALLFIGIISCSTFQDDFDENPILQEASLRTVLNESQQAGLDIVTRDGCDYCHAPLEPLASYTFQNLDPQPPYVINQTYISAVEVVNHHPADLGSDMILTDIEKANVVAFLNFLAQDN